MEADASGTRYKGMMDAFGTIAREEGLRGLYTGLSYMSIVSNTLSICGKTLSICGNKGCSSVLQSIHTVLQFCHWLIVASYCNGRCRHFPCAAVSITVAPYVVIISILLPHMVIMDQ